MNWHRLVSTQYFYTLAGKLLPISASVTFLCFGLGLWGGLWLAPADYQQGDAFRIIYLHVPCAAFSLLVYAIMAFLSLIYLIWKIKLADILAKVSAPIGASFTLLALITGSLWGKPMWGTWWIWDARLTSELILLFLYLGIIALRSAMEDFSIAAKTVAMLTLIGAIDVPIIHYSVNWWNTLHQPASLLQLAKPTIAMNMLWPLLIMLVALGGYYLTVLLLSARNEILRREIATRWVSEL
ncbi:MAG: heme ABC transporter permease [Coxiellaceae bacterium]|nr:MAG: heme ABC transporter permease [Coxiellaceae bacterium]